jgi:hypothetical protein
MNSYSKWYFYSFILYQIHFVVLIERQQMVFSLKPVHTGSISAPSLGLHSILVGEVRLEGVQLLIFRLIGENGCLGHGVMAWQWLLVPGTL